LLRQKFGHFGYTVSLAAALELLGALLFLTGPALIPNILSAWLINFLGNICLKFT
jgi:membrane-bound metal-dependent hydrolase YbcI (DUF457 family)